VAFTGAHERRIGRFELAQGGLSSWMRSAKSMQHPGQAPALPRERTFERVGSSKTLSADIRIVAASTKSWRPGSSRIVSRRSLLPAPRTRDHLPRCANGGAIFHCSPVLHVRERPGKRQSVRQFPAKPWMC